MRLLLDTHVLLWAAGDPARLGPARAELEDPAAQPLFSAASPWEVAIKSGLNRPDFRADAHELRAGLLANGWEELPVPGATRSWSPPCPRSTATPSTGSWWRRCWPRASPS